MQKPKLVIFDCDGVLVDSEAISARILVQELAKFEVIVSEQEVFDNFVGRSLADVLGSLQMSTDSGVIEAFSVAHHAALIESFRLELQAMAGIREILSHLNVPYCVATSSSRPRVLNSLKSTKLDGFFDNNIFTSSQVRRGKPAPDLFLFAAKEMGASPNSCLVIEDSLPGVQAALAAEMQVWRFTGGSHFVKTHPDITATAPGIPTFDKWETFFDWGPKLKAEKP
jgi:HAD superfamily hydrolase (TIGR01509 family)